MSIPFPHPAATLANCDTEPIHIPGTIQSHGLLLAFDAAGRLEAWSANAEAMLGVALRPGLDAASLPPLAGDAELLQELAACRAAAEAGTVAAPVAVAVALQGSEHDALLHAAEGRVIVEVERRAQTADELAAFALKAHRSLSDLKRARGVEALLQSAADQVRAITGFDRLMAYRFRHDASGEVVAEAKIDALEPYLGTRYPASDIPAQARRLYTLSTLRLIADVASAPVPLLGAGGGAPVDLSYAVLRSVSPIHIEYLRNMGVGASMSVSIVIDGKLWGMLACHHGGPRHVPHSVRMACDVIAQVLAASLQSTLQRERSEQLGEAAALRVRLAQSLLDADDVLSALHLFEDDLRRGLGADALVLADQGKLTATAGLPEGFAAEIVASLAAAGHADVVERSARADWPEALRGSIGKWVGMLALPFDPAARGWIVALRAEQIETVRWGGRPQKEIVPGPLGPRLTPRGSFEEWRETVRDTAAPWSETTVQIGRDLLAEAQRASATRYATVDRARTHLLAMLGHDLRNPLQTISMAANLLQISGGEDRIGGRLKTASGRMQRLITDVMDMSRLHTGLGLGMALERTDLRALVVELVEEMKLGHPGVVYLLDAGAAVHAHADRDRLAQVVNNLVSNARHHGEPGQPVRIGLVQTAAGGAAISVRNAGAPIPDELAAGMFNPFKRTSLHNPTNRTGLGIGLYIASEIVSGHGGTLAYAYEAPHVVFTVELPPAAT